MLSLGAYDADLVDTYFGPREWKPAPRSDDQNKAFPKEHFQDEAAGLLRQFNAVEAARLNPLERQRYAFLRSQLEAIKVRIYLLSGVSREEALTWSMTYELKTPEKAARSVRFVEQYRSYIVNYAVGEDLVKRHVEKRTGWTGKAKTRWRLLEELFTTPHTPADL